MTKLRIKEVNERSFNKNEISDSIYVMADEMSYGDYDDYFQELFEPYDINIYDYKNYDELINNINEETLKECYIQVSNDYIRWLIKTVDGGDNMLNPFVEYIDMLLDIINEASFKVEANAELKQNLLLLSKYLINSKKILNKIVEC